METTLIGFGKKDKEKPTSFQTDQLQVHTRVWLQCSVKQQGFDDFGFVLLFPVTITAFSWDDSKSVNFFKKL